MSTIKWPFGAADSQTITTAATIEIPVTNNRTIVKLSAAMAAAMTINLAIDDEVEAGADLFIEAGSDGTARAITFGTGMEGASLSGTISKANVIHAVYDGEVFQVVGARLLS